MKDCLADDFRSAWESRFRVVERVVVVVGDGFSVVVEFAENSWGESYADRRCELGHGLDPFGGRGDGFGRPGGAVSDGCMTDGLGCQERFRGGRIGLGGRGRGGGGSVGGRLGRLTWLGDRPRGRGRKSPLGEDAGFRENVLTTLLRETLDGYAPTT